MRLRWMSLQWMWIRHGCDHIGYGWISGALLLTPTLALHRLCCWWSTLSRWGGESTMRASCTIAANRADPLACGCTVCGPHPLPARSCPREFACTTAVMHPVGVICATFSLRKLAHGERTFRISLMPANAHFVFCKSATVASDQSNRFAPNVISGGCCRVSSCRIDPPFFGASFTRIILVCLEYPNRHCLQAISPTALVVRADVINKVDLKLFGCSSQKTKKRPALRHANSRGRILVA
jgi:hypothetical protein